jgi:L-lactate utilization protein LutB
MNRRDFLQSAVAGATSFALRGTSYADANDLNAIRAQIEKRHDESVKRLQEWIRQPSIAAENKGVSEGCDLTMRLFRDAGLVR